MNRSEFLKLGIATLGALMTRKSFGAKKEKQSLLLELKGESLKASEIKLKDGGSLIGPGKIILGPEEAALLLDGKNITIRDVAFKAKKSEAAHDAVLQLSENSENITIENCVFEGERYCALMADKNSTKDKDLKFKSPATNLKFLNNKVSGFSRHLYLHSVHGILIQGNEFTGPLRDSIRLRQNIKKVTIADNRFSKIGSGSKESSDAVDAFWSGDELIIRGNHIDGCDAHGLDIKGISPDKDSKTSKVIISSNLVQNCRFSGVLLSSGSIIKGKENEVQNFIITDNIILKTNLNAKNPNDAAIFSRHGVKGVSIRGNEIAPAFGHGIVLGNFEDLANQSKKFIVTENQVKVRGKSAKCLVSLGVDELVVGRNIFEFSKGSKAMEVSKSYRKFKAKDALLEKNLEKAI